MLEQIGIEPQLLLFQIINFLVLLWLLKKLLYKPLLDLMAERQEKIDEGLKLQEEMEKRRSELEKEREEILREARDDAQVLIEKKKEEANSVKEKIISEAREEKKEIVEQGKKEIESRRKEMEAELEDQVVEIAAAMAAKAVGNMLADKGKQEEIIDKELDMLSAAQFKKK